MYDELIKRLRECVSGECWNCSQHKDSYDGQRTCADNLMKQAADAIEELQKAVYFHKYNSEFWGDKYNSLVDEKWIPVTERLPKCNGCYLVWRPHFFGGEIGMPSICYFDGSNTWHDSYGVDFERILHPKDVTHWMPLPEPPKGE